MKHLNDTRHLTVLESLYYSFVSWWREPVHASMEAMKITQQNALIDGSIEFSMSSAMQSVRQSFLCGTNLTELDNDCTAHIIEMVRMNSLSMIANPFCLTY